MAEESIFDFAAKKSRAVHKKKAVEPPIASTSLPVRKETNTDDFKERLEQVSRQREELDRLVNELYQKTGHTRDSAAQFLANPNNFSDITWKGIQERREQLSLQIAQFRGGTSSTVQELRQAAKSNENKRKSKTIGFRKKNWLNM